MTFELHPSLAKKILLLDLPLCRVLLEDEKNYVWLMLVPRRAGISRMMDLAWVDQVQLMRELDSVQKVLWAEYHPTQLNVAAIGNKTPQLHLHVIVRHEKDPAWPGVVWDHPIRARREEKTREERIQRLQTLLTEIYFELDA